MLGFIKLKSSYFKIHPCMSKLWTGKNHHTYKKNVLWSLCVTLTFDLQTWSGVQWDTHFCQVVSKSIHKWSYGLDMKFWQVKHMEGRNYKNIYASPQVVDRHKIFNSIMSKWFKVISSSNTFTLTYIIKYNLPTFLSWSSVSFLRVLIFSLKSSMVLFNILFSSLTSWF